MRIKVVQIPTLSEVDGVRLDVFRPGIQYEMGNSLGALFLAEGWAVPVDSTESAMLIPISEFVADRETAEPQNLVREVWPPYYDGPALAADRRRRPRRPSDRHH
jgi:hypothetical protein